MTSELARADRYDARTCSGDAQAREVLTKVTDKSIAYFGLRTNAYQLVSGAGVNAVRRRIKLAGLLHDEVALEAGLYLLTAGGGSSVPMYMSQPPDEDESRFQTPPTRL